MKKNILYWLNIILFVAMSVHIWVAGIHHANAILNSAPAYVVILNAVYYTLPITAVNLYGWSRKLGMPRVYIANILLMVAMVVSGWIVAVSEFEATFYSRFPYVTAAVNLIWLMAVLALNLYGIFRRK